MKNIRLENFRCFQSKQSVPLAPLTLLVGENSTGKTSFMALIHALNGIMTGRTLSNSWGSPFHFGNFEQIAFDKKTAGEEHRIDMGFDLEFPDKSDLQCDFVIKALNSAPHPDSSRIKFDDVWTTISSNTGEKDAARITVEFQKETQKFDFPIIISDIWSFQLWRLVDIVLSSLIAEKLQNSPNAPKISSESLRTTERFQTTMESLRNFSSYAGAPTRSKPQRTYDLIPSAHDAEGAHIMVYLAELSRNNKKAWESLQKNLQDFGEFAGLFDRITIENYGGGPDDPFQVHVREYKKDGSGKVQNLIDVGYGVNQIIPVVAELFRRSPPTVFLLQQPEIHLHPSAQAALGSLFCDFASWDKQMIVETHSDHLVDRVRMDVRDEKSSLTKDDVLLLFFERLESDVKIHPIRFDEDGNVVGPPDSYRRFFMDETNRSIGW